MDSFQEVLSEVLDAFPCVDAMLLEALLASTPHGVITSDICSQLGLPVGLSFRSALEGKYEHVMSVDDPVWLDGPTTIVGPDGRPWDKPVLRVVFKVRFSVCKRREVFHHHSSVPSS